MAKKKNTYKKPLEYRAIVSSEDNRLTVNGYIGFFCKKCFEHMIEKVKDFVWFDQLDTFKHAKFLAEFEVTCPRCNYISKWSDFLDPNITPVLALLNLKGYTTYQACEGHPYGKNDRASYDAYILFKYDIFKDHNIGCPVGWKIEDDGHYCTYDEEKLKIRYHDSACIRCDTKIPLSTRIRNLEEWAKKLPCLDGNL